VKQTDMLKPFFSHEWQTEAFQPHQFAPMLLGWMDMHLGVRWTSSLPDSHARTLAVQERERDWKVSEAVFFTKSCAWPKKSSPRSYSLKTYPQSEHGDWTELSKNLPKQGMTVGGVCYPLPKLAHLTSEKDGSVLPEGYCPTPTNNMTNRSLEAWETHRARDNNKSGGMDLTVWVQKWPTPCAMDSLPPKSDKALARVMGDIRPGRTGAPSLKDDRRLDGAETPLTPETNLTVGRLNPTWVEWLMNFPLEWTELNDLGMQWFRHKPGKRLKS